MASSGQVPRSPAVAPVASTAEAHRRRGVSVLRPAGTSGRAQGGSRECGEHNHGHNIGTRASEGADRGGAAQQRCGLAPSSNRANDRATNREIRAWGGCSPREETLEHLSNVGDAGRPQVDSDGASATRGERW
jgi:hypothetical protein